MSRALPQLATSREGLDVLVLGGSWDLITTYNWADNPTYNWG